MSKKLNLLAVLVISSLPTLALAMLPSSASRICESKDGSRKVFCSTSLSARTVGGVCTISYEPEDFWLSVKDDENDGVLRKMILVWSLLPEDNPDIYQYRFKSNGIDIGFNSYPHEDFKNGKILENHPDQYQWRAVKKSDSSAGYTHKYSVNAQWRKKKNGHWADCAPHDPIIAND